MRRFVLLSCAIASACASGPQPKLDELKSAVEAYNEAYRWKNYPRAASFLPPKQRPAFVASYEEDDKSLHIEGYQVIAVNVSSPEIADVKIRYQFMQLPSVTLEKRIVTQHWALVNGSWILEYEDAPIRPIDPALVKDLSESTFGGPPTEEVNIEDTPEDVLEVEVVDSQGNVVRRRAEVLESPEESSPNDE
ncbi:MAG: hypothetical protein AAFU79_10365 [Myxococcota bacterium]